MKAILTLFFGIIFGFNSLAQNTKSHDTVEPIKMDIILVTRIDNPVDSKKSEKTACEKSIARLYKFKNSTVKKALAFTTKRNKPKTT